MAGEAIGLEAFLDMRQFDAASGRYSKILDGMNRQTDKTAGSISSQFDSLGKHVLGVAAGLGTAVVAGAAAAGAAVAAFTVGGIKSAIDMEAQLSNIAAVLNMTKEEVQPLSELIIDLGLDPTLKVTAQEAADAIEMLARNGLTMTEIMDGAAQSSVLLANSTGTDLANAANIATDSMAIFDIAAKDMIDAVDGIVSVTTASKFSINDYALALAQGGGVAAAVGVNFQDFNTSIAAVSPLFKSGSDAGTSFKTFLQRLVPQTDKAAGAMADLGLEFFNADGSMKSMSEISQELNKALLQTRDITVEVGGRTAEQSAELDRLRGIYARTVQSIGDYEAGIKGASLTEEARAKKLEELSTVLANTQAQMDPLLAITGEMTTATKKLTQEELNRALTTIFGTDAMRTAIALAESGAVVYETAAEAAQALGVSIEEIGTLAEDGITEYEALMIQMGQTSALESAKTRMDNLAGIMEIVHGIFEAVQLQIGQYFLPLLTDLSGRFRDLAEDAAPKVIAVFQRVASFIGDFITSLLAGEGIMVAFFKGLREAEVPGDVIGKLITFATNVENVVTAVRDFVTKHADAFKGALIGIGAVLAGSVIVTVLTGIGVALGALLTGIGPVILVMAALGAAISSNFAGMGDAVSTIVAAVQDGSFTWSLLWQQIVDVAANVWAMIQPHLVALWANITAWFASIDWLGLVQTAVATIASTFGRLWEFVLPHLQGFWTSVTTWFSGIDWLGLATTAVNLFITGFGTLGEKIGEFFGTFATRLTAQINSINWETVGRTVITAIGNAIVAAVAGLATIALAIYTYLSNLWNSQDWGTLGRNLLSAVFNALSGFAAGAMPVLAGWWQAFANWFGGIDWAQIGLDIITFVVEGLANFSSFVVTTLQGWETAFFDWVANIDWYQIGYDIVSFIIFALVEFPKQVQATLAEWVEAFWDWVTETDWEQMGTDTETAIIEGLAQFVLDVIATLNDWWTTIKGWFDSISWSSLADTVIDGLIGGLQAGAGAIGSAISGLVQGAIGAWNDATQSESPSKVFWDLAGNAIAGLVGGLDEGRVAIIDTIGVVVADLVTTAEQGLQAANPMAWGQSLAQQIAEGVMTGAEDVAAAMEGIMDFAGTFSSLGNTAAKRFKDTVLGPMEDELGGLDKTMGDLGKTFAESLGLEGGLAGIRANLPMIKLMRSTGRLTADQEFMLNHFLKLEAERGELAQEYAEQQERILKLQKAQQDLQFLEQQMKLLDLIAEHGLDASILEGLQLGIGADEGAVVDAMAQAIQAIIDQAEGQLGIASPSKIFTRIGEFVNEGLAQGLSMLRPVESAMSQLDRAMTGMGMDLPGMANAAYSRLGGASLPAGPAGPSMVTLDPASLRALQTGSVSNSRTYQLNTSTRESQMSLRQQFRLMEMIE